ncbi:MAG: maltotransferase domain-containing protein, partial [Actinomycetota bacterium]
MLDPILIEHVRPSTPTGNYPAKAVAGERVTVSADILKEGHDVLAARVVWGPSGTGGARAEEREAPMTSLGNDAWETTIVPDQIGPHTFQVEAWTAEPAGDDRSSSVPMKLWVDRPRALSGAWYEMFPRSEGGLEGAAKRLPAIADMGFDIVYLPPVHPIGIRHRKGKNNTLTAEPGDPGSPWAIGSEEGGHTAIHSDLGTFEDFDRLVDEAARLGMEIALDFALQCSAD